MPSGRNPTVLLKEQMNRIGILQERLLPKSLDRLQVFPSETWEREFEVARECGFSAFELLFDVETHDKDPLMYREGREKIAQLSKEAGLPVSSICADFFQGYGFFGNSCEAREGNVAKLERLIESCRVIGGKMILIPFFEATEIKSSEDKRGVIGVIEAVSEKLKRHGINLGLETTLPAAELTRLMEDINHPNIKVYYDLGNSIPLGYNATEEIHQLSQWIGGVHVKDRDANGANVVLGTGLVDFEGCFRAMEDIGYGGAYILETTTGDNPVEMAKYHLSFVQELLGRLGVGGKLS